MQTYDIFTHKNTSLAKLKYIKNTSEKYYNSDLVHFKNTNKDSFITQQ